MDRERPSLPAYVQTDLVNLIPMPIRGNMGRKNLSRIKSGLDMPPAVLLLYQAVKASDPAMG